MNRIAHYTPPTPADLANLKRNLELSSAQMGELCALAQGGHFRKYTSPNGGRKMSVERHFLMAALLALAPAELAKILETMRAQGAEVEIAAL